jgi:response regulator NasT
MSLSPRTTPTLTQYLIEERRRFPDASGDFNALILDVAMARFEYEEGLRAERDQAKSDLQDRTTIDRAKALLMKRQGLTEDQAFSKLRKVAMDKGLKMGEVAQRMLDMADLLT